MTYGTEHELSKTILKRFHRNNEENRIDRYIVMNQFRGKKLHIIRNDLLGRTAESFLYRNLLRQWQKVILYNSNHIFSDICNHSKII